MKAFTFFLFFFCLLETNAQVAFQKIYSASPNNSISLYGFPKLTYDGGCITAGEANNNQNGGIFLMKTDSLGNLKWTKIYNDIFNHVSVRSAIQTQDNGFVVTGSVIDYDSTGNASDAFLMKTDDTGKVLWFKCYGGKEDEAAYSVAQTKDRGFIMTGGASGFSYSGMYVIKTDSLGDIIWTKTYSDSSGYFPIGTHIKEVEDGYALGGQYSSGGSSRPPSLIKLDTAGNFLWAKEYKSGFYFDNLKAFNVAKDGYILGGVSANFNSKHTKDAHLIKTDFAGNVVWANTYSRADFTTQIIFVMQTNDGGFVASVHASAQDSNQYIILLKTDPGGAVEWSRRIGQPHLQQGGTVGGQTKDNGYLIAGSLFDPSLPAAYSYNLKTDSLGNAGCFTDSFNFTVTQALPVVSNVGFSIFGTLDSSTSWMPAVLSIEGTDSALCLTTTPISDLPAKKPAKLLVYPNPSKGWVSVESEVPVLEVEIKTILGTSVYKQSSYSEKLSIDLGNQPPGIYFYTIRTKSSIENGKLILQ